MAIVPLIDKEKEIINSGIFEESIKWGKPREGHPEGQLGNHISHILKYIEQHYKTDPDYWNLRIIALLHDIGKPYVVDRMKEPHAVVSSKIAYQFITDNRLLKIILLHDKYYSFYLTFKEDNRFNLGKFYTLFKEVDICLLLKFCYADSCDRETVSIEWFKEKLKEASLL